MGMFCRFGLTEESRPVAATAWSGDGIAPAAELFQDLGTGRVALRLLCLLERREAHLLEEDEAELLRRLEVEALAGLPVDLLLQGGHLGTQLDRHLPEIVHVKLDAGLLHAHQDGHQGSLDLAIDLRQRSRLQLPPHRLRHAAGDHDALGGVGSQAGVAHRRLLPLLPAHLLEGEGLAAQALQGHLVEGVAVDRGLEKVGDQHGVEQRRLAEGTGAEPQDFL
jgi:hypothetical protein